MNQLVIHVATAICVVTLTHNLIHLIMKARDTNVNRKLAEIDQQAHGKPFSA